MNPNIVHEPIENEFALIHSVLQHDNRLRLARFIDYAATVSPFRRVMEVAERHIFEKVIQRKMPCEKVRWYVMHEDNSFVTIMYEQGGIDYSEVVTVPNE